MIPQIPTDDYADSSNVQMKSSALEGKDPLTRQIIGCCFKVHRELGPGFPEKVYQAALTVSLQDAGLVVERERRFTVTFEGATVGEFQADMLVERRVILELKAVTGIMPKVYAAQLLAYLKASGLPVGLLVNFGNSSCQVNRLVFSSAKSGLTEAFSTSHRRNQPELSRNPR